MLAPYAATVIFLMQCALSLASPDWAALFLSPSDQKALCAKLLVRGVPSAAQPHCQHLTIIFDPPDMGYYAPRFGERVAVQPLAYARDDGDQAILCRVANSSIRSTNSFPHITISDAGTPPYTAVYSNFLWERLSQPFGPLVVSRGFDGAPLDLSLPGAAAWSGRLGPIALENVTYASTAAEVRMLPGFPPLLATFCAASRWNATAGACAAAPQGR